MTSDTIRSYVQTTRHIHHINVVRVAINKMKHCLNIVRHNTRNHNGKTLRWQIVQRHLWDVLDVFIVCANPTSNFTAFNIRLAVFFFVSEVAIVIVVSDDGRSIYGVA